MSESRSRPSFFDQIQEGARRRWDQLEGDEEIAAPWWLLFRQVQNPRHVLSELLQNADDAGASWARASVADGTFVFEHNGHDFTEDEFRSLCRFGFSNKRRLLTIGFRGIGFRSVFSLGDAVKVATPTLAIRFERNRFTEPTWESDVPIINHTKISVRISDHEKISELEGQLEGWGRSAHPLLFFQSVREFVLKEKSIRTEVLGPGPTPFSERRVLAGEEVIVFRDELVPFPADCLAEIRSERGDPNLELPPCEVILVAGKEAKNRLYVVLPTDVMVPLPVSCHAPFVQDPARERIKEPSVSPTNRWLLRRIGTSLAKTMLTWLGEEHLSMISRSEAYRLLPETPAIVGDGLSETCARFMLAAFREEIIKGQVLLTTDGNLRKKNNTASLPAPIVATWGDDVARTIFAPEKEALLAHEVSKAALTRLSAWDLIQIISPSDVLGRLQDQTAPPPPSPSELQALTRLWDYAQGHIEKERWKWISWWTQAAVIPVAGSGHLSRACDVVVIPTKPKDCPEDAWQFLLDRVKVAEGRWIQFLRSLEKKDPGTLEQLRSTLGADFKNDLVIRVLEGFRQSETNRESRIENLVSLSASRIFANNPPLITDALRIVSVAAHLDVALHDGDEWKVLFLCRDGNWRARTEGLVVEDTEDYEYLLPRGWVLGHAISADYLPHNDSRREIEEFLCWLCDPEKGRIASFPIPEKIINHMWSKFRLESFCKEQGVALPLPYQIKREAFTVRDWNWPKAFWDYWSIRERDGHEVWKDVAKTVLRSWGKPWQEKTHAEIRQEGNTYSYPLSTGNLQASWLKQLRNKSCVPDDRKRLQVPAVLFRRTGETVGLLNVEPFVLEEWDTPNHSQALDALGVRSKPKGIGSLLERLRALSQSERPPLTGLLDLYRAIERSTVHMAQEEIRSLRESFSRERLIFTESGWEIRELAFLQNPHSVPGMSVLFLELSDLPRLWGLLEIRNEPREEDVTAWVRSIPIGARLGASDRKRLVSVLAAYPKAIWKDISIWLSLTGELRSISDFSWVCYQPSAVQHVFEHVKAATADLSMVNPHRAPESIGEFPAALEGAIHRHVVRWEEGDKDSSWEGQDWHCQLGKLVARLQGKEDAQEDILADRQTALRLARTVWRSVSSLRVQPHIGAEPIGPDRDERVAWEGESLYLVGSPARVYEELIRELTRPFLTPQAKSAIRACALRDQNFIDAYVAQHLVLDPAQEALAKEDKDVDKSQKDDTDRRLVLEDKSQGNDISAPHLEGEGEQAFDPTVGENDDTDHHPPKGTHTGDTAKQSFLRYIKRKGFVLNPDTGIWTDDQGWTISPTDGHFKWELQEQDSVSPIWVAPKAFNSDRGVEVPAEVWIALERRNGFLLEPQGDDFIWHRHKDLKDLMDKGALVIFPALYRVRQVGTQ
jgi:hypothetical protein